MEGMEKFFMCYLLFIVSFWKAEIFGRKKARKAQKTERSLKLESGKGFKGVLRSTG